jgi:glycosyltransferase involved in cell wall biosynthesis
MSAVSVLILTLNEEANLTGCIESCAWSDDIVVFDSISTDRTKDIALAMGARVLERPFDNYAAQRNAALSEVPYKHPWVLFVDADERITKELAAEIELSVKTADSETAIFRMRRKDFFLGRWLRRSSGYPTWFGRLVKIGRVRVARAVNEEYVTDGKIGQLGGHLHHYPFNRGIAYWIERHNRYSSMEALAKIEEQSRPLHLAPVFSRDSVERRRSLKQLLYRIPLRPMIVFLYLYVWRLGVIDGAAGFHFCRLRAIYEFFIDLKVLEEARRKKGFDV